MDDRGDWLALIDPAQRERMLNIGARAWDLRVCGFRMPDIYQALDSEAVGNPASYIDNCIELYLASREPEDVERVRLLEIDRLDRLQQALNDRISFGDVKAVQASLKISESRRKLYKIDDTSLHITMREEVSQVDAEIQALIDAMEIREEEEMMRDE